MRHEIRYVPAALEHLRFLRKHEQIRVLHEVETDLRHQPEVATRNRKPLRPNPIAPWELRIGHLRVYYDVQAEPDMVAVGIKERNRVLIGGKEARL
jgi:mRNA-degrading endonuclease RelE of RelBE toxin-antitoxin system